jgi:hypothetical protein
MITREQILGILNGFNDIVDDLVELIGVECEAAYLKGADEAYDQGWADGYELGGVDAQPESLSLAEAFDAGFEAGLEAIEEEEDGIECNEDYLRGYQDGYDDNLE